MLVASRFIRASNMLLACAGAEHRGIKFLGGLGIRCGLAASLKALAFQCNLGEHLRLTSHKGRKLVNMCHFLGLLGNGFRPQFAPPWLVLAAAGCQCGRPVHSVSDASRWVRSSVSNASSCFPSTNQPSFPVLHGCGFLVWDSKQEWGNRLTLSMTGCKSNNHPTAGLSMPRVWQEYHNKAEQTFGAIVAELANSRFIKGSATAQAFEQ